MGAPLTDPFYLSPKSFASNDVLFETICVKQALYVDTIGGGSVTPIADLAALNAKAGFTAGDPTRIEKNLSVDPLFTNAAVGDLSVLNGSPLIDAGESYEGSLPDVLGVTRPQGAAFDIGAYER